MPVNLFAKRYTVRLIPSGEARDYVRARHYSRSSHARPWPCFGLFEGKKMVGVCLFATPCSEAVRASIFGPHKKSSVIELHRFFIEDGTPRNMESWMVARSLRLLRQTRPETKAVISFSDPSAQHSTTGIKHTGTIYRASNALYLGRTTRRRFFVDPEGRLRHPRQCGHNVTLVEAAAMGWVPEWRDGKYRYLFLLGGRVQKIWLRRSLKVTPLPYWTADGERSMNLLQAAWKLCSIAWKELRHMLQFRCRPTHAGTSSTPDQGLLSISAQLNSKQAA